MKTYRLEFQILHSLNNTRHLHTDWFCTWYFEYMWSHVVTIASGCGMDRMGDVILIEVWFSTPFQNDPENHPASCKICTGFSHRVKRPELSADHSSLFSAGLRMVMCCTSTSLLLPHRHVIGWSLSLTLMQVLPFMTSFSARNGILRGWHTHIHRKSRICDF